MATDNAPAKEIIRRALQDAINWQQSLLDAHRHIQDDPYVGEIQEMLASYRKLYKRRYGNAAARGDHA